MDAAARGRPGRRYPERRELQGLLLVGIVLATEIVLLAAMAASHHSHAALAHGSHMTMAVPNHHHLAAQHAEQPLLVIVQAGIKRLGRLGDLLYRRGGLG